MNNALKKIVPMGHIFLKDNILERGCLTGVNESKSAWAKDLDLPKEGEYIFFAGCGYQHMKYVEGMMGALKSMEKVGLGVGKLIGLSKALGKVGFDITNITAKITAAKEDPFTEILSRAISVLRKLGVNIGYMHEAEPCCGSPLYYAGFIDEYKAHAGKNYQIFKDLGVKKIIGLIPACTSALKNVYPQFIAGYDLEVHHFLEIVIKKIKETGIKPKLKERLTITYHDPCQQSRYLELINEPREIIKMIEGVEFRELGEEQTGKWSTCCGGGGLEVVNPELSERIGMRRMEEIIKTGASMVLTNCPACESQLYRVARKINSQIKIADLVKFIDEALEK